jgi:hypothetical protein
MNFRGSLMDAVNTFKIVILINMVIDSFTCISVLLMCAVFCLCTLASATS